MNTEKAIRLYDAITEVREDWVEDALPPEKVRRHPHLRAGAAVAAIIPLVLLAAFALALSLYALSVAASRAMGLSPDSPLGWKTAAWMGMNLILLGIYCLFIWKSLSLRPVSKK